MPDMVTHTQLTKLINILYGIDSDGVCHGLASMTLQAFFLKDIDHFVKRLELLGKLMKTAESAGVTLEELAHGLKYPYDDKDNSVFRNKLDRFFKFWNDIKSYLGQSQCSTNSVLFEAKKENWNKVRTDILAFLDGVSLNFSTRNYPELFPDGTVLGQNPELSLSVTYPADSQSTPDQGPELSAPNSPLVQNFPSRTASFSGIYSHAELIGYFNVLNGLMLERNKPIGFVLNSHNHAIALGYDPAKQQWLLFDSNKLPFVAIENGEQFAAEIRSSFFEKGKYACFSIDCYQIPSEHNLTEENFNSISEWSNLHEVTGRTDRKTQGGTSWLYIAAQNGHVGVVEIFLGLRDENNQRVVNPNQANRDGKTPLYIAAQNGHVGVVEALLANGANPNEPCNGLTPLFMAAQNGHVGVVRALLEKGANPDQVCEGLTPLFIAAQNGHVGVVEALLVKGANPDQVCEGLTSLFIAAENGHVGVVEALLRNQRVIDPDQVCEGLTPLFIAAAKGYVGVVEALLADQRIDPNKADLYGGTTPLYAAAENGQVGVVEVLLRNEAVRTFIREKVHEPSGIELLKMLSTCGIDGPTLCELLLFVEPNREACLSLLEQMPLSEHITRDLVVKGILEAKEAEANERTFNDFKTAVLQACDRYNEVIGDLHEGTFFGGLFDRYQSEERRYVMKLQQDLDDGLIANIEQLTERIASIGEVADWSIANDVFSEINPSRVEIQSPQPQEESPCTP